MSISHKVGSVTCLGRGAALFSGLVLLLLVTAAPALLLLASERVLYQSWLRAESERIVATSDGSAHVIVAGSVEMTEGAAAQNYTAGTRKKKAAQSWSPSRRESGNTGGSSTANRSGLLTTGVPNVIQLWPQGELPSVESGNGGITFQNPLPARNTYRTLCVRLCDGYYWPVSFATTRDRLSDDAATCKSSCGAPTRLFYYSNPGGEPEQMRDLNGNSYARLPTAFLYRTHYAASCKCQPDPWEEASLAKHRAYAALAAAKKTKVANAAKKKRKKSTQPDGANVTVVSFTSSEPVLETQAEPGEDFGSDGMIKVIASKSKKKGGKKIIATVKVIKGKATKSGLLGSSNGVMKFKADGAAGPRVRRLQSSRAKQ